MVRRGVHVVQMYARPHLPGISTPDCLHKDGEPYTFVHLIERRDVVGGESVVVDNAKAPLFEGVLTEQLDSLDIRDAAVYHQVRRISVPPGVEHGYRTALLIDFTPLSPRT